MCLRYIAPFLLICFTGLLQLTGRVAAQTPQLPELQQELLQQPDSTGYVTVLGKIGTLYAVINLDSSFYYALKVREISARLHYNKGLADANDILSFYYALKTDFGVAGIYAYKALQVHEQLGDSARMAKTLSNIYLYYRNMGRPADANNYFYKAFHLASRLPPDNDSVYGILLMNYVMRFYTDSTRTDSVKWALKAARRVVAKYPRSKVSFYITAFEMGFLVKQGRGKEAEDSIYVLAARALKSGMPYVAMDMYGRLDDFPRLGYQPDVERYQELAYQLGVQTGSIELNLYWLARLYDYYNKRQQPGKMVMYGREIMRLAAQPRYQGSEKAYDYSGFFLKEQAMESLAMQNQVQQLTLGKMVAEKENRRLLLAGLFTVSMLLIALFTSRYWHYKHLKQQENELAYGYAQVERTHIALKENDDFKNKLINILARDFREPLQRLITVAGQFQSGSLSRHEMSVLLKHISNTSARTLTAFDNILKWIRLQLAGFNYQPVPCKLLPSIEAVLLSLREDISHKGLRVVNQLSPDLQVTADEEILGLVNTQLLQIAVAAAEAGSLLIIAAAEVRGSIAVKITVDVGGAAKTLMAELNNWQESRLALGLVISRDLMELMKGTIITEDQIRPYLVFGYIMQ